MPGMLTDRVIVITGGAGLLGRGFCDAVAAEGAIAVVADRDAAAARVTAGAIVGRGDRAEAAVIDITNRASLDTLIAGLAGRHGRIDAVVNAAYPRNAQYGRRLEEVEYADFCDNVSQHLGGYFLVAQRFATYFASHGGGTIVNVSSIYGLVAPRFEIYAGTGMTSPVEYAAIKAGVIHLTRYFAQYFKKAGVRCNALAPGGILDAQPAAFLAAYADHCASKGMLDPADVTGALLFLLSDQARHMTGQCLVVDDGFTL